MIAAVGKLDAEPPFTHTLDGHWAITPLRVHVPVPANPGGPTDFDNPFDPFGDLSTEIGGLFPNQVSNFNQLYSHPGFIDNTTFPTDLPTSGLAYSFMDPTIAFPTTGGPPPGITVFPTEVQEAVPEPSTLVLAGLGLSGLSSIALRKKYRRG